MAGFLAAASKKKDANDEQVDGVERNNKRRFLKSRKSFQEEEPSISTSQIRTRIIVDEPSEIEASSSISRPPQVIINNENYVDYSIVEELPSKRRMNLSKFRKFFSLKHRNSNSNRPNNKKRRRKKSKTKNQTADQSSENSQQRQQQEQRRQSHKPNEPYVTTHADLIALRQNLALMDRERSTMTADLSYDDSSIVLNDDHVDYNDSNDDGDATVKNGNMDHPPTSSSAHLWDSSNHTVTEDSTVVASNKSGVVTRMLCNSVNSQTVILQDTTLREVKMWRQAATDLLLLS